MKSAILFTIGLTSSLSILAAAEPPVRAISPMRIPKNEALLDKGAKMPELAIEKLKEAFNLAADQVRVVSILSPTCSACQNGHAAVKKVFTSLKSEKMKGLLVWLPMRSKDNAHMALAQSKDLKDSRIVIEGWDSDKAIAKTFSKTLSLKVAAWDVYLVYAPGVKWTESAPPVPTFWMHQLGEEDGADQKQCLNVGRLKSEIKKLL